MSEFQNVCVVGLGYIGLPTASLLATKGYDVHGVDVQPKVVDTINAGKIHITEPELDVLVRSAVQSSRLKASLEPAEADVFILAVPTPFVDGYVPDLSYVEKATRAVAPYIKEGDLLILESTSPVGTTEKVGEWLSQSCPDLSGEGVYIAHCPERVLPGQILRELVSNDRIVGGLSDTATEVAANFYRRFVSGKILTTTSRTAELAKLTENTFRDVNIALANELSLICEKLEIDVWELIQLANHHPRVNILQPGPGVGGHCIAVDPWFLVSSAPDQAKLVRTAREVNESKPEHVVQRVLAKAQRIKDPVIACFGLAYKADIDDLRESPALAITQRIAAAGIGSVVAVEPNIHVLPSDLASHGVRMLSEAEALAEADIVVGLVDHRSFKRLRPNDLAEKVVIDTRGMWR